MVKKLNIKGLIAATFTPMTSDFSINLKVIDKYANYLKKNGVEGVFVSGTTGEGGLLNIDERKLVLQEWIKHKSKDFKIISHVGSSSYKLSEELATHSQNLKVDGISSMGPSFLSPNDTESLIDFCKPIAIAAKNIPFYYYHIPPVSHVKIGMKNFLKKASKRIPNLVGIKFSHHDLMEYQQCLNFKNGHFEILHGYDEVLLAGLSIGAIGAVGSTYNYMSSHYKKIINYFDTGKIEEARKIQQFSVNMVEILNKYGGGVRAGKAIMKIIGIDCGPSRAPVKIFSSSEINSLISDLQSVGFI